MDKYAIIVAGGSGSRMGGILPKQFLMLGNKPLLWYSITAFLDAFADIQVVLVLPETYLESAQDIIQSTRAPGQVTTIAGGSTRFESVKNGLAVVPGNAMVFVHDGVRCLVSASLISRCYEDALEWGNAVPAVSAVDTIRIETITGNEMIDRTTVKIIQTPQAFLSQTLKTAYNQAYQDMFTDDASVVENLGEKIHLVEGEVSNIKITRKIDLLIAEQILRERYEL